MLLCFGDVHLGHKLYHTLTEFNITTSEETTMFALNKIKFRAMEPDITAIFCLGDLFHSPKPSTENIRYIIWWLEEMDKIGKPFYILTGNHDVGALSTSLRFTHSLKFKNIFIVENKVHTEKWGDRWNMHIIPFVSVTSLKNKYEDTLALINQVTSNINVEENNIVFTHVQEKVSTLGAEKYMFARAVEVVDLDRHAGLNKNSIFVSGHMHAHQMYEKRNGLRVVYPGSLTYMESIDCGLQKGYVLIDYDGNVKFEELGGIRVFKKYLLPQDVFVADFFNSVQLLSNEVVFLEVSPEDKVSEHEVREILKDRGCTLGKLIRLPKQRAGQVHTNENPAVTNSPAVQLENFLDGFEYEKKDLDWRTHILPIGKEMLNVTGND